MSFEYVDILDSRRVGDNDYPVSFRININANEMGLLFFSFKLGEFSGVDALNPVKFKVESTFNGEEWEEVPGAASVNVSDSDYHTWKKDQSDNSIIGPIVRITWYLDNPGRFSVLDVKKSSIDSNAPVFNSVSLSTGSITASTSYERDGVETGVIHDTTTPANNRPLPTGVFDLSTGNSLGVNADGSINTSSGLPYGADYQGFSHGATTTVIEYRTGGSGGSLVHTTTITFSDSSKTEIVSIEEA